MNVRGRKFFLCEYTGAPCDVRFFIPTGKQNRAKRGCYASLPVLLRHQLELQKNQWTPEMEELKQRLEDFYVQPNIPVQQPLDPNRVPLSRDELHDYLSEMDMGLAWLRVEGGQTLERPSKRQKIDEN